MTSPTSRSTRGSQQASQKDESKHPAAKATGPARRSYNKRNDTNDNLTHGHGKQAGRDGFDRQSALDVTVSGTKSEDMILLLETSNRMPPFFWYTYDKLQQDEYLRRVVLGINLVLDKRDPENPRERLYRMVNGRMRSYPVLVKLLQSSDQNTAANRKLFAESFIAFYNHPDNQSMYKFTLRARFKGDVTPQDQSTAPAMSHWLTIADTMDVCREAIAPDEEDMAARESGVQPDDRLIPITSVLRHDDALHDYYEDADYPLVLQEYAGVDPAEAETGQPREPGTFHGLRPLTFDRH